MMESMDKKFSVVVIAYNQADYIKETIESVLNQTYQNFEVIIADDSSTDNLQEVLNCIQDDRIKYVKTPYNMGLNANISNGLKISDGDYIVLLGGDDKLRPNHFEKMLETFQNNDVDAVYCQITNIDKNGNYILGENVPLWESKNRTKSKFLHDFFTKNLISSPGMTVKKEAITSILPLNLSNVLYQDYKIHVDLLINGYNIKVIDDILVDYRQFFDNRNISDNSNGTSSKRAFLETNTLLNSYLKINDIDLLTEVFKEEIESSGVKPYPQTIPFFLGKMALMIKNNEHIQIWGFRTISDFISKKENYDLVHELYGFTFKDLLNLPKYIELKTDYINKKYKKYKKLFNVFLVISIILFIINIFVLWRFASI